MRTPRVAVRGAPIRSRASSDTPGRAARGSRRRGGGRHPATARHPRVPRRGDERRVGDALSAVSAASEHRASCEWTALRAHVTRRAALARPFVATRGIRRTEVAHRDSPVREHHVENPAIAHVDHDGGVAAALPRIRSHDVRKQAGTDVVPTGPRDATATALQPSDIYRPALGNPRGQDPADQSTHQPHCSGPTTASAAR